MSFANRTAESQQPIEQDQNAMINLAGAKFLTYGVDRTAGEKVFILVIDRCRPSHSTCFDKQVWTMVHWWKDPVTNARIAILYVNIIFLLLGTYG